MQVCIWSARETLTMRISKNPTTVMTANGEVQTREEATVYVKELDLFVTVMLLEQTPAVLSLGKLCEDHGYIYHWTSGQRTTSHQKWLAKESIAIYRTTYHSLPLVCRRVPLQRPHLLFHHLHRRIQYLTLADTPKIPVPEKSGSTSEELRRNPMHKPTET